MSDETVRSRYAPCMVGLAVLFVVLGVTAKPLARWVSPQLAVSAAHRSGYVFFSNFKDGAVSSRERDPWGNTWRWRQVESPSLGNWFTGNKKSYALYSSGPNGIDEALAGDDLLVKPHWAAAFLDWSGELFAGLLLLVLWLTLGPGVRRPRSPSRLREALFVALIASFPIGVSVVFLLWVQTQSWAVTLQESQPIVLGTQNPIAWYGSAVLAWLIVAVLLRAWVAPPPADE